MLEGEKMTEKELMEAIFLPQDEQEVVQSFRMEEVEYKNWKELFYRDEPRFFEEIDEREDKGRLLLWLYIRFAVDCYGDFCREGISDEIYFDTFYDITIWAKKYHKKYGVPGLMEEKWLAVHMKGRIYRLGRLQFEPDEKEAVIHVHIPEGEGLYEEECDLAFAKADTFFSDVYQMYDCESWLLSPELSKMLDSSSNIIKFQKRFQIVKTVYTFRQAEERVFGEILENKVDYPEETSLQRKLKAYVLDGKDPGMGYGIIDRYSK